MTDNVIPLPLKQQWHRKGDPLPNGWRIKAEGKENVIIEKVNTND